MASRLERIAQQMKDANEADELVLLPIPAWADQILHGHDPGYLTDPATVDLKPLVIEGSRDMTEAEIAQYQQGVLSRRRAMAEPTLGTKAEPAHLNDQAREIRAHRQEA